jgi:beta-mannosidase
VNFSGISPPPPRAYLQLLLTLRVYRPEPFKFIHFPAPEDLGYKVTMAPDGESVKLSTERPMKGIVLDVDGEDAKWNDQAIDLVPGDPQVVQVIGLKGRKIKSRYLGDGTA